MPNLHESESLSTAAEFGQPLSLPPDRYEQGYTDGYVDAARGEVDLADGTDRTAINLYEGFLGTVGEPMVGMPAEEEAEAVPEETLPLEWKLHVNPRRAEKLADRRSHGDRRSLPRRETPARVLRWLVDDGSEEIDDGWPDVSLFSDEVEPAQVQPAPPQEQEIFVDEVEDVELHDSFAEARARVREAIDEIFEAHERAEEWAAVALEERYQAEIDDFNAAEAGEAEAVRSTEALFCDPESFAEYMRFKASQGGSGVGLWQTGSGSSQGGPSARRAA